MRLLHLQIYYTEDMWEYLTRHMMDTLYTDGNKTTASNTSLVMGSIRLKQFRQNSDIGKYSS